MRRYWPAGSHRRRCCRFCPYPCAPIVSNSFMRDPHLLKCAPHCPSAPLPTNIFPQVGNDIAGHAPDHVGGKGGCYGPRRRTWGAAVTKGHGNQGKRGCCGPRRRVIGAWPKAPYPLASTTWISTSASTRSLRNLLPLPRPLYAPETA